MQQRHPIYSYWHRNPGSQGTNAGVPGGDRKIEYTRALINTYLASEVWPLIDISSGIVIKASVNVARNGVETGWDLQNTAGPVTGTLAPYNDGTSDYGDLYSASLASLWNGDEGSVFGWFKADGAIWTDGVARVLAILLVDTNNFMIISRTTTNNQLDFRWVAGGSMQQVLTTFSSSDWFSVGMSRSKSGNEMKTFINGAQVGTTQAGAVAWVGSLSATGCYLMSRDTLTRRWKGWAAYFAIKCGAIWTPSDFASMHAAT